jgi:transposase
MTNSKRPYKTFTREFKLEAVRLMNESNRPTAEIATELGIRRNQLYKWKEQMEKKGEESLTIKKTILESNGDWFPSSFRR